MNILVIGSGGREHALCWKLRQSPLVKEIYASPGNGGTALEGVNVDINLTEHQKVADFCKEKNIDLVVVGPEAPLAVGIVDNLEKEDISVFGPSYAAARLESSKIFAKELMGRYNIPTASFRIFDDFEKAEEHIRSVGAPIVVKAYGLAAGKGVIVAEDVNTAVNAAREMLVEKKFDSAGSRIIVEECLRGEEASILVLTDGENIVPLATSQDHKRANDGDTGPNTGGMGAYSPAPVIDDALFEKVMEIIILPTIEALKKEGIVYKGVLYAGLMITEDGPKVLEYNVRFGDPETQAILPRMKSDLAELLASSAMGELADKSVEWEDDDCVCVVLASGGYPGEYQKGKKITGLDEARGEGAVIFHAGTRREGEDLVTSGGRVLGVAGKGSGIKQAVANTYRAVERIHFDRMHYRGDIGHRAISRVNA
ncbi:MAG: phosphoribosylamine--glycine ligase [Candidatus Omnitrophica bacterium]|nr:phosphoribosylamine--glycine ligase [Candidatus Omnitrophota bacterium]